VVKQLAVEDHDDAPVLVGDRLLAIREANDAQAARSQRDPRLKKEALFVRAAMHNGPRHPPHDFLRNGPMVVKTDHACDAAHKHILYDVRRLLAKVFSLKAMYFAILP
jgi:hypothetical protein